MTFADLLWKHLQAFGEMPVAQIVADMAAFQRFGRHPEIPADLECIPETLRELERAGRVKLVGEEWHWLPAKADARQTNLF